MVRCNATKAGQSEDARLSGREVFGKSTRSSKWPDDWVGGPDAGAQGNERKWIPNVSGGRLREQS